MLAVIMVVSIVLSVNITAAAAASGVAGSSSLAGANEISVGTEYVTEIGEGEHWYKFTTDSEDAHYYLISKNIDVKVSTSLSAEICTAFKEVLFKNTTYGGTEERISDGKLEPNTVYYLRIKNARYSSNGNFKFQIVKKADPDKNDMANATNIELNKEYNRNIGGPYDVDWFAFKTDEGTKYIYYGKNIDVVTASYFRLILVNSYNEVIQKHEFYGANQERVAVLELEPNTTYYIRTENSSKDSTRYYSSDSGYNFSVSKPEIKSEHVTVADNDYVYNGKAKKPKVTVKYDNEILKSGTDYTVTYSNNTNAGKATVTVKGIGSYIGTVTNKFTIAKASQKLSVKSTSYTKTLGSKSFSVKTSGKGKVTYTPSNKKVVTVSSSGLVTVKGAGKAKITVKAAGDTNYKSATKTISITVKPKTPSKVSQPKASRCSSSKVKISWKKVSKATGYQISKSKTKSGTSIVATCKSSTSSKTISAKKGTGYYYKVRAYTKVNGVTSYGSWSTVKYYK